MPFIIFVVDDKFRKDYENPFWVGKAFSFCYMNKDAKRMKNWSDEKIYQKIDELQYSIPLISDDYSDFYWRNFELVSSRRFGWSIVCTYSILPFADDERLPPFYSVVLQPIAPDSLWEKFRSFISDLPLGHKVFRPPRHKERWLVLDFFTDDDSEKYIPIFYKEKIDIQEFQKQMNQWERDIEQMDIEKEMKRTMKEVEQMKVFEKKWADREKIQQNEEVKKLYMDYLKIHEKE